MPVFTSTRARLLTLLGLASATLLPCAPVHAGDVRIHEIFYHPPSELDREEWVELANTGTNTVDVSGWRFTEGVRFTFPPATSIPPGEFLVVAADLASFKALHPSVTNVVAGWDGILSNSGQRIRLVDAQGKAVDDVRYADDGEWADRVRDAVDYGHRGWKWESPADGAGKSLELQQVSLPSEHGRNWSPSLVAGGTPGRANSTFTTNLPPIIAEVRHRPWIPRSSEPVVVHARLIDEAAVNSMQATLHWRLDGAATFAAVPMLDDGASQDGAAGDGVFGAVIPPQPNESIIEFYVSATDPSGQSRTWPAPALDDGVPKQALNALYAVDDVQQVALPSPGELPRYRLILLAADRAELESINRNSPAAPFPQPSPYNDQTRSHAQFNATFISADGTGAGIRYLVGVRNRGNGSRSKLPQSLRLHLRNDDLWNKASALNLNSQYSPAQLLGSALYQRAGLPTADSRAVLLRLNHRDLQSSTSPNFGFYVANEVINSEFAARAFPSDSSGNLYRAVRLTGNGADLSYLGTNATPYRENYFKQSNTSQDEWSDLVELCRVLDDEPEATLATAIRRVINVDAWMRYFALETLVYNRETNLGNANNGTGAGDDYHLYFGRNDPRAVVVPYDLDTILGMGDTSFDPNGGLFRMAANPQVSRFIKHPEFVPEYYEMLLRLASAEFAAPRIEPLVDEVLGGITPEAIRQSFKDFAAARLAGVLAQIPVTLTATNPTATVTGGTFVTSGTTFSLVGRAHAASTRKVLVNGQPASWSAWDASWTNASIVLGPGQNRILVQSMDADGIETSRLVVPVLSTASAGTTTSGTLASNTRWTRAGSPWRVTSSLTVANGATLVIEPGTTVHLAAGANFTVANGGRLLAEGTEALPIIFAKDPSAASNWGGLRLNGGPTSPESRIIHAWIDGNGSAAIQATDATLVLDHVGFGNTTRQYLSLDASSFVISHCHFPNPTAPFEPLHGSDGIKPGGVGILRHCFVGAPIGYNDAFDFTGGNRPGQPILQVIHNVFAGSGDDQLDLDGTDAWVEGNIFLHVHRNGSPDSASAVSGGNGSGQTSEVTVVGNLFYDCDQAVTAKQGNFYALLGNTVVLITKQGGLDSEAALLNLADDGTTAGAGMLLMDNVVSDVEALARNYNAAASNIAFHGNLLPLPWNGPGSSNLLGSPVFNRWPSLSETFFTNFESAQVLRSWFQQAPGSPGSGIAGFDAPRGVRLLGTPTGITRSRDAVLRVGPFVTNAIPASWANGAGFTRYRWSLDDGPWSDWTESHQPIVLSGLADGRHQVAVVGLNDAGLAQDDPLLGEDALVTRTAAWIVDSQRTRLLIHEILARNQSIPTGPGAFSDWIEILNDGNAPMDVSGIGIASSTNQPPAFRFPAGTVLGPGELRVLTANNDAPASPTHVPLGLDGSGDRLFLLGRDGSVLDSVEFGPQVVDRSLGRLPDDSWALCEPTPGSANRPAPLASIPSLKINEWLAASAALFSQDFVELFNPDDLPAPLGGLFLTDNPIGAPRRHALPPHGFIDGRSYVALIADGNAEAGPGHLGFKLDSANGVLQIATADTVLDTVFYGPQFSDVSQGRSPNGSSNIRFLSVPTPGTGNPGGSGGETNVVATNLDLVTFTNSWRFFQAGAPPAGWMNPGFNDDAWPSGNALFYVGNDTFTLAKNTSLTLGKSAYYFRTRFTTATTNPAAILRIHTLIDDGALVWLNGQPLYRQNLNQASPAYTDYAASTVSKASFNGPTDLPSTWLLPGENVLAVEVHQANASSSDVTFAIRLFQYLATTNVSSPTQPVVLNEVVASNNAFPESNGALVDWVELFNPNPTAVDVGGLALTDDTAQPNRFVFPAGTIIGGRTHQRVQLVSPTSWEIPSSNTLSASFGLNADGDRLYLLDTVANGRALLDAVAFGHLPRNLSLARVPDGDGPWTLSLPSPNSTNQPVALANASGVTLNEWMANPASGEDWLELHNPAAAPVDLSGWYLTDNLTLPTKHRIPAHTYLGTGADAFLRVQADGTASTSASHANFKLDAKGESLGLANPSGVLVQSLSFGASSPGVSEGRLPDDGPVIMRFPTLPTPGASNRADNDRDGLPDDWESSNGLSGLDASDALGDLDGDGASNREEYLAGTRANDPSSVFAIHMARADDGSLRLQFTAIAGRSYSIEHRPSLESGSWTTALRIPARAADRPFEAIVSTEVEARFLRIITD